MEESKTTSLIDRYSLFGRVFSESPVGMGLLSAVDGVYVDANDTLADLLGYTRDELRGQPFTSVGTDLELDMAMMLHALRENRQLADIPISITRRDGQQRFCVLSLHLEAIEGHEYFFLIVQDITPHETARLELEHLENRFRLFYESVPLPLLVIDQESGRIMDVNPAATTLYGYRRDEFLRLTLADLLPAGFFAAAPLNALDGGQATLTCHRLKDGRMIDALVSSYSFMLDEHPVTLSIIQDVTEQRAVQAALEASEERLRLIADMTADAIWDRDLNTNQVTWSAGLQTQFGYEPAQVSTSESWRELVHPDDRAAVVASIDEALESDASYWTSEYRFRRADGNFAAVLDNAHIVRDDTGRPTRFIGSMVDITEQLKLADVATNAALEERQRLAHTLHDSVSQSLYTISLLAEASRRRAMAGEQQIVTEYVGRLGELTVQTLRQMRLLLYDLRPGVLDQEGLSGALRHRLEAVEHRAGIRARLIDHTLAPIPPRLQRDIFWIAQEALNNSLRHASATTVTVTLSSKGEDIVLEVEDNGQGFDPAQLEAGGGLTAIRRRVGDLHGEMSVCSRADKGTVLSVRVPV